jgi:cytochrome c biogenesis protein CcmG/thiol:disulfide interchange protein DsbE
MAQTAAHAYDDRMDRPDTEAAGVSSVMTATGPAPDSADMVAGVDERPQRRREWAGGVRSVVVPLLALAAIVGAVWYLQTREGGGAVRDSAAGIVRLREGLNTTGRPPAGEVGRTAPDFVLPTLDGGSLRLSDLRGKVVLLNFWASWCGPCRQEAPELVRADAAGRGDGLVIVGIDLQEAEGPAREFVEQFGLTFPIAFDRTGEVAGAYRAEKPPTSVFVDRDGVVRYVKLGPMTGDELSRKLAELQ